MNGCGPRMGTSEWLLLGLLSLLWGTSFSIIAVAVREVPPLTMVFFRVLFAALVLILLMRVFRMPLPRGRAAWMAVTASAVLANVVPFSLIVWGQQYVQSSLAGILMATGPLFTLVIAHFLTQDERMSPGKTAALVAGFLAVVIMIGPDVLAGLGKDVTGQFAILTAALFYASASVYGRRFQAMGLKPLPLAAAQMTVATVLMLPLMLTMEQPWELARPSSAAMLAVLASGVVSTGLPYIIYFRILAVGGATNVMLVTFLVPVVAAVTGATLLGEVLELRHFAGMGLLALALVAIDGRLARKFTCAR